jgi:predicted dehydrogenase
MADLTRRSFLEHTLYTAAAGLAVAQSARGATDKDKDNDTDQPKPATQGSRKTSPNERIGIAVIGLHGRGQDHIDAYTYDDRVEIVAVCDVDEHQFGKSQAKLQERGRRNAKTYQDIRKLLEDKDVQAVSIATPNHWHALAGIWAMQSGRDAYVEKPASHEVLEGKRLEEARVKYNRICQVGTQSRSTTACQNAIKHIHDGKIGKVVLSRGLCYKRRESIGHYDDSPTPKGVDYDIWLGPAPERPFNKNRFLYNWHWNWAYGNGDIGNQGVHQMDIARWALNKTLPKSVISIGGRFGYKDDGQTPNTLLSLYDYGDSKLLFEVRGLVTSALMGVSTGNIVYGTEGFVAFTADYGSAAAFDNKGKLVKSFKGGGSHFHNYVSAILSRQQSDLNCPVLDGHYSAALCHLGNISYRLGQEQAFPVRNKEVLEDMDLAEAFGRFEQHLADNSFSTKSPTAEPADQGPPYNPKTHKPGQPEQKHSQQSVSASDSPSSSNAPGNSNGSGNSHAPKDAHSKDSAHARSSHSPTRSHSTADAAASKETPLKLQEMTYMLGPKLEFDPDALNFGNNAKANELLTREYRAPFVVPDKV